MLDTSMLLVHGFCLHYNVYLRSKWFLIQPGDRMTYSLGKPTSSSQLGSPRPDRRHVQADNTWMARQRTIAFEDASIPPIALASTNLISLKESPYFSALDVRHGFP